MHSVYVCVIYVPVYGHNGDKEEGMQTQHVGTVGISG